MSVGELIEGLSAEAREAIRPLLRQAYDRGFREGLAGAGVAVVPAVAAEKALEPAAAHASAPSQSAVPVAWKGKLDDGPGVTPSDVDDGGDDDDDPEEAAASRPILANAKVGTLRRRIIRTFDLERFDIEVVVCRSGDPDRRQLKSSARLASYRREEG